MWVQKVSDSIECDFARPDPGVALTVIDIHRGFISTGVDLGEGRECVGEVEKLIPLIQQVAEFADRLCKLS